MKAEARDLSNVRCGAAACCKLSVSFRPTQADVWPVGLARRYAVPAVRGRTELGGEAVDLGEAMAAGHVLVRLRRKIFVEPLKVDRLGCADPDPVLNHEVAIFKLKVAVADVGLDAEDLAGRGLERQVRKQGLEHRDGLFEVRAYPPTIVAQVIMPGDRRKAISAGFGVIAGYIFRGNATQQKVAMTAPVMQQRVAAEKAGPKTDTSWTIRFVMPRTWSLTTLPRPSDARVAVVAQPAERYAVVRFSGLASDATITGKERALRDYMASRRLNGVGTPVFAFYDPPGTLSFLRRNKIMIGLSSADVR